MFECPKCKQTHKFSVQCSVVKTFEFAINGDILDSEITSDTEWSDDSIVRCDDRECEHSGPAVEFERKDV